MNPPPAEATTRPPAPKTARGARTRAQILKAAEATFGQAGYYRSGISDITRAAGVAQGTFYSYFAGKEDILRELVNDMGHDVRARLSARTMRAHNPVHAAEAGLRAFLQYDTAHPALFPLTHAPRPDDRYGNSLYVSENHGG